MTLNSAMIFAAGYGKRMGALTKTRPKPLIPVRGRPLIDYALKVTEGAGIKNRVVNLHYLADQIEAHLQGVANVTLSREAPVPLETGGGLKQALPLLGPGPVFTLNPDVVWTGENPLRQLAGNWQPDLMDALMLLVPVQQAIGYNGRGDFTMHSDGRISRDCTGPEPHFVYTGAQILDTGGLASIAEPVFSLMVVWTQMIAVGRLYGCVHQGRWADVGTMANISKAEHLLASATNV